MRGRKAGHRCALPCSPGSDAEADKDLRAIVLDLDEGTPVGGPELDAIEAWLMPEILALLAAGTAADSEVPQSSASERDRNRLRGASREILAEETV